MLDSEINEQLASAAGVEEGDVVLEIGPGTGSLSDVLLNAGAVVLAVEKVIWFLLMELVSSYTKLHIHMLFPSW